MPTSSIAEISDWVLRSAITAAAEWHHGAWPEARRGGTEIAFHPNRVLMPDSSGVPLMADLLRASERGLCAILVSGDIHISALLRARARRHDSSFATSTRSFPSAMPTGRM